MKYNTPARLTVFNKEAARLHQMLRSSRYDYEKKLALTMSNSPKPFFAYVRRGRELRMDVENVIVKGVELSPPAELCEVFRSYFSSTFRNDEGNYPQLNHSAISRMQHFTISAEDVHRQLINLNPKREKVQTKQSF